MNWKKIALAALIGLLACGPAFGSGGKKALLVGVSRYQNADGSRLKHLRGPENDVDLIRRSLLPVLGFSPSDIRVLKGADATRDAIRREIGWLAEGTGVSERFFFFAGHGSQVADQDGDEGRDRLDEVILPYEARYDAAGRLRAETVIRDDDLKAWFAPMAGKKLVAVLDSCHSGTGFRGLTQFRSFSLVQNRFAASADQSMATRSGGIGYLANAGQNAAGPPEQRDRIPENHIYFYASKSDRVAQEVDRNGRFAGFFTQAFVDAARRVAARSGGDRSYLALFRETDRIMSDEINISQRPDIQPDYLGANPSAYRGTPSERLLEPVVAASAPAAQAAVSTSHLPDVDRYRTRVRLVREGGPSLGPGDFRGMSDVAEVVFDGSGGSISLYATVRDNPRRVELTNENGYRLNEFSFSGKADLLTKLNRRIRHQYLKDLLGEIESRREMPFTLEAMYRGRPYERNDFYCGQQVLYRICGQADAYVYLISVDAGGELNILLPFSLQPENRVRRGETLLLPDPKICGPGVVLEISAEPGEEIVKMIASPRRLTIGMAEESRAANGDDLLTQVNFEQAREAVAGLIRQLRGRDGWSAGTKRFMNYSRPEYDRMYGNR